jgi:6-phosphogluconolactonase
MKVAAKYKPNVEILPDAESLAHRCAELFVAEAQKAIKVKNIFYVAVSGGHTPKRFFQLLGKVPKARCLPWDKIQIFWVDERYVPPDSPFSNYKLAADAFLTKVAIPQENIHRIPTEDSDIKVAARYYEDAIRRVFSLKEKEIPEFDLIVLGMGTDGHTGSLFPYSDALLDTENLVTVFYALNDKLARRTRLLAGGLNRITLTEPVICAASHLIVLISGEEMAGILKEVLKSSPDKARYPIHILWPILDKVTWLVDKDAAKSWLVTNKIGNRKPVT